MRRLIPILVLAAACAAAGCKSDPAEQAAKQVERLSSGSGGQVRKAEKYFRSHTDGEARVALNKLALDKSATPAARGRALVLIAERRDDVLPIRRVLNEKSGAPALLLTAIDSARVVGDPTAVRDLDRLSSHSDAQVAAAAEETNRKIRAGALEWLLAYGDQHAATEEDWVKLVRRSEPFVGEADVPALLELFDVMDESGDVRVEVVDILAGIKGPEASRFLRERLGDEDPRVRGAAIVAVVTRNDREAIPMLKVMAQKEPQAAIRQGAVGALQRFEKAAAADSSSSATKEVGG